MGERGAGEQLLRSLTWWCGLNSRYKSPSLSVCRRRPSRINPIIFKLGDLPGACYAPLCLVSMGRRARETACMLVWDSAVARCAARCPCLPAAGVRGFGLWEGSCGCMQLLLHSIRFRICTYECLASRCSAPPLHSVLAVSLLPVVSYAVGSGVFTRGSSATRLTTGHTQKTQLNSQQRANTTPLQPPTTGQLGPSPRQAADRARQGPPPPAASDRTIRVGHHFFLPALVLWTRSPKKPVRPAPAAVRRQPRTRPTTSFLSWGGGGELVGGFRGRGVGG